MSGRERCIWCGEDWPKFYRDKPYCVWCASGCKRECRTCHKPYPELRFFKNGADCCNLCESRWERKQMKKMAGLNLQVVDLTASPFRWRFLSPMSYSDGELSKAFEPKLSSSEKKRKRRTSSSKRIESDTEEEEVGGEEEEGGNGDDYDCKDVEEQQQQKSSVSEKKSEFTTTDKDEEGHEEEVMKWGKKSKKVKNPTETLLDYINVGQKKGKKKEVSFELAIKKKKCKSKQGSHMALCRALFGSSWWFMSWLVVISSDSCHGSWWFNVMVRGGSWWFNVMVRGGSWWFVVVRGGLMSWFVVVRSGLMSWFVVVRSGSWWFNVMVRGGLMS